MSGRLFYLLATVFFLLLYPYITLAQTKPLSPEEFLGYSLGSRFTSHHNVVDYFRYVSLNSNQVKVESYGETYENRPLMLAFISTRENLSKLETIRTNNLKRAQILPGEPSEAGPAILWFSYNVHGNESVSTEAALATLYALIDEKDIEKQKWLKNTIIVIDPAVNPDGRERYVNFYKQWGNKIPNPNPESKEHHEPWPGGRTNHYLFDLNRDWAWQTQIESKQRLRIYNSWLPHIHVDFHEQGYNSPYYFAPAAEPLHNVITQWQRDFQFQIGQNHARYFDRNNWLYFTKEHFDLLYPSYGDTYPIYNGAIGMTYEQGGSGRAGITVLTAEKDTLTLKDRIEHHFTTGMSTIEISSKNADRIVSEFENYFKEDKSKNTFKSYVVKNSTNKGKTRDLMNFLDELGISYGKGKSSKNLKGFQYSSKTTKKFDVDETDLVISASQPKSVLLQVLFDPNPKLTDSLTYDITAWGIPYVYDLETFATLTEVAVEKLVAETLAEKTKVKDKPYAYLSEWKNIHHLKFFSSLLAAGVKVRHTTEPFSIAGKKYAEGSLIITRTGNEHLQASFDEIVLEEAHKLNVEIFPVATGMVGEGKDFGSGTIKMLQAPKVAVVGGNHISALAFGEVWHYFEQDIKYPITVLDTDYIDEINFLSYDVLIFPSGDYATALTPETFDNLFLWIKRGGNLILLEAALASFIGKEGVALKKYISEEEKKELEEAKEQGEVKIDKPDLYKNRFRKRISNQSLGGIFKVALDNSHPLGFGYPTYYYTLKNNVDRYQYLDKGWNVGTIKDTSSLMSGFVGFNVRENLKDALVFGVQELGKGSIIYMGDNPLFRSFWYNGKLLFGNAVFLVNQ